MSYDKPCFLGSIDGSSVKTIFELGSLSLVDGVKLRDRYGASVYSFECNPKSLEMCRKTFEELEDKSNIYLVEKAVSSKSGKLTFHPMDPDKHDNPGASSALILDHTNRNGKERDEIEKGYQSTITVDAISVDDFCEENGIEQIDMLCMDLQGFEMEALKGMERMLGTVKYIITESCVVPSYVGGSCFSVMEKYLVERGFKYEVSTRFGRSRPDQTIKHFCEFDVLFTRISP